MRLPLVIPSHLDRRRRIGAFNEALRHVYLAVRSAGTQKALEDRVEIIEAKTRTRESPYYQINPSGRVPYLIDDAGVGMEDSQLICAYLDGRDGKPRFHKPLSGADWAYLRLEFMARSMCDGISVWTREMNRPANERSPTVLAHEVAAASAWREFLRAIWPIRCCEGHSAWRI